MWILASVRSISIWYGHPARGIKLAHGLRMRSFVRNKQSPSSEQSKASMMGTRGHRIHISCPSLWCFLSLTTFSVSS